MAAAKKTVPFVVDARGSGVAQTLTVSGENQHVFHADTYPSFGGDDAHPSPLSYVLGALTSCNQVTGSIVAKDLGLTLGTWTFHVQGDLDPSVIGAGAEGNANFDRIALRLELQTDADAEQFARLKAETERRCPVTQMVKRSGLEFTSDWSAAPLA
ncbi:OsmC family peroxiredoxin [Kineococcus sp. R8]|uniref:OsmC family protein n=1 Tax=Kineococcus siccus TaxID=2696567 RepID=UPI00141213E3|nr:OsmC family peroxiredoxin [Kineococcus siccus]